MTRDQFISICFIAIFSFVIYSIFVIFSPFGKAIFWASILSYAFYPVYAKIRKSIIPHDLSASLVMTSIIFLIVIPPVIFFILRLTAQAIEFYHWAGEYIKLGKLEQLIEHIRSIHYVQVIENRLVEWDIVKKNLAEWLLNSSKALGNFTAAQAGTLTKNLLLVSLNVFLLTCLMFVFFKDGKKIVQFIYDIAPLENKDKKTVFHILNETLSAVIRGQMLTSLVQAIVAGMVFWLLRIPMPVLFGAFTFLASLVPVLGAAAIWFPLVIYLFIFQEYVKAMILFMVGVFVISLIDNIMKPAIIGEKTKLPYFLLFFGILGGLRIFGFQGIFIAPVVLALFFALVKIYQEKFICPSADSKSASHLE